MISLRHGPEFRFGSHRDQLRLALTVDNTTANAVLCADAELVQQMVQRLRQLPVVEQRDRRGACARYRVAKRRKDVLTGVEQGNR